MTAALGCSAGLVLPLRNAAAQHAAPTWTRDENDPRWVQGSVVVAAAPAAVWRRLARVPEWPRLFTDVKSLRIIESRADYWRLKVESRTFDYGAYEYQAKFEPAARTARGWFGGAGVSAVCHMRVLDRPDPATSRVTCSLFIDARGIAAWIIGKDEIRRKQEHMVTQYLADFQRAFARAPA